MKKFTVVLLFCLSFSGILYSQEEPTTAAGVSFLIVRITDHSKNLSFKVMSQQEYRALSGEIAAEGRCWDKAMNAAEKEWKANPETSKKSFPRNAIGPKRASISQTFASEEKANAKVSAFEKREAEMLELDKKREEEREKRKTGNQKKPPSVVKAEQAKQQMEDQRSKLMQDAVAMFETKLAEALAGQTGAAPQPVAESKPAKTEAKAKK